MAVDKPLQDVYSTVRLGVADTILSVDSDNMAQSGSSTYNNTDYGFYWNCYPHNFTDRTQNQYASQFDTWVEKRSPVRYGQLTDIANGTIPTANSTTAIDHISVSNLDDIFVAAVFDATVGGHRIIQYRPNAGTSLQIGIFAGTNIADTICLEEIVLANVPVLLVTYTNYLETISSGAYATSAGGVFVAASLTNIGDVDFPGNIAGVVARGRFVYQNGWTYVMSKQGGVYNSELNSITSWNALGVVLAQAYPDQGVSLIRYKNHIVAFGEDSIEFFNNTGIGGTPTNPKSPLQVTDQAFIKFGANFCKSILSIEDTLYWWANSKSGKLGLYRLDGYTPVKISSYKDDLAAYAGYAGSAQRTVSLYLLLDRGKQHIISTINFSASMLDAVQDAANITFPNTAGFPSDPYSLNSSPFATANLCWDLSTGFSWGWAYMPMIAIGTIAFPLFAQNFFSPMLSFNQYAPCLMADYAPSVNSGRPGLTNKIYYNTIVTGSNNPTYSPEYSDRYASTNYPIACAVGFNAWDFGTEKRKRIHKIKVILREVGAAVSAPTVVPWTWIVYSKQDGNLNNNGLYAGTTKLFKRACRSILGIPRSYTNNLGTARKWLFMVVQKSPQPFLLRAIELDISQGTS